MKIVFMGTPGFATPALKRLIQSHHQVTAVVTQPDKPVGRGQKMHSPPVKEVALEHNIPVLQPPKLRNAGFDKVLQVYAPDVIVVVAYGKIIPPEILSLPRFGCVNIHGSILPKYRGAAPIQWAIIKGERRTGVTIMKLDEGMDTGEIIAIEEVDILDDDDTQSVSNLLSVVGAELLLKVLDEAERTGKLESTPQDASQATYAPILKKADGLIDWNQANEEIICRIMGLQPWPTAFSFLHGQAWRFLRAEPLEDPDRLYFPEPTGPDARYRREMDPGRVTALIRGKGFTVKTGDGHLLVTAVQPAGKKAMTGTDVVNGKILNKGDEFISDPAFLAGTRDVQ
jgi:methionyl-tRNA formyltransferase